MLAKDQAKEILRVLSRLPSEKVAEVQDYLGFLEERYGVDQSDSWSDQDLEDFASAALAYADPEP